MTASEMNRKSVEDLDEAIRQLDVQLLMAAGELRHDLAGAFERPDLGQSWLMEAIRRGTVEKAIASLERDPLRHFGFQRHAFLMFGASRHPDVRAALARLPERIRETAALYTRIRGLQTTRAQLLARKDSRDLSDRSQERRATERQPERTREGSRPRPRTGPSSDD